MLNEWKTNELVASTIPPDIFLFLRKSKLIFGIFDFKTTGFTNCVINVECWMSPDCRVTAGQPGPGLPVQLRGERGLRPRRGARPADGPPRRGGHLLRLLQDNPRRGRVIHSCRPCRILIL